MKQAAPNIDQAEIGKFDQLASRWWDPDSEFKPLHDINPLRLDYINRRVALAERKVIDVGCGGGLLAEGMARMGRGAVAYIGLDDDLDAVYQFYQAVRHPALTDIRIDWGYFYLAAPAGSVSRSPTTCDG